MRYRVTLEYLGTRFHGFQKQPEVPTVQGALEDALRTLTGVETRVQGAGRTDAGVHAVGQVAAFDVEREAEPGALQRRLNALLPAGVSVIETARVLGDFDPRRDASSREYRYFILNRPAPSPLLEGLVLHYPHELDTGAMSRACAAFVGERDLSAFRCGHKDADTVRVVSACRFEAPRPGLYRVTVRARSFLYRMVRTICGALVEVGAGKMTVDELAAHLEGGEGPCAAPLPAHGLYLWKVEYPEGRLEEPSP